MHRKAPISLLSLSALFSPILAASAHASVCNANHIFNAIHSSMRQWGGSLNHNGMSIFLATVPEGTQLYHGTSEADPIKGMQWLAFEPEHALIFARPWGGRGPGASPPDEGPLVEKQSEVDELVHNEEYWRYYGPPPGYRHGPEHEHEHEYRPLRPSHYEHYDKPDLRPPPYEEGDAEHRRSPPPYERRPCNGTDWHPPPHHEHGPSPPDHERGPRKHREHGPPPPLPPGHIYKPYPPPPRKERQHKGQRRPWDPEHRRPPPRNHHDDLPEHHSPPPPEYYDHRRPSSLGHRNHHTDSSEHRGPPEQREHEDHTETLELRSGHETSTRFSWKRQTQQPLVSSPSPSEEKVGYLHTYRPLHDLHLLYIDGLSAGKTANGTLDTQDLLLLNLSSSDPHGPMGGEMSRAQGLCELASTIWEGRVDGVIRLEGGFEIILCDFEKHLERTDVISVTGGERGRGPMGGWEYTKAVASRYHGIGGGRVHVDYSAFVSVFAYPDVQGVWENDVQSDVRMPRLTHVPSSDLAKIKDDVTALILSKDWNAHPRHDWQAVADMFVQRYSKPLHHIITTRAFRKDKEEIALYLSGLLRPFISTGERNATRETARCVAQILPVLPSLNIPPGSLPPLAHRALHTVGTRICDTLLTSLSIATSPTPHSSYSTVYAEHAVEVVAELVEWLGWTSWKECGACGDEEVCFIPIWPTGTFEDHAKPRCRGAKEAEGRMGYWGVRRGGPPGGKPPGDGKKKKGWW